MEGRKEWAKEKKEKWKLVTYLKSMQKLTYNGSRTKMYELKLTEYSEENMMTKEEKRSGNNFMDTPSTWQLTRIIRGELNYIKLKT